MLVRYNALCQRFRRIGLLALTAQNEDLCQRLYKEPSGLTAEQYEQCFAALNRMNHVVYFGDEHHWVKPRKWNPNDRRYDTEDSDVMTFLGITSSFMGHRDQEVPFTKFVTKRKGFFLIRRIFVCTKKQELRIEYYRINRPSEAKEYGYWDEDKDLPRDTYAQYLEDCREAKICAVLGEDDDTDNYNDNLSVYELERQARAAKAKEAQRWTTFTVSDKWTGSFYVA